MSNPGTIYSWIIPLHKPFWLQAPLWNSSFSYEKSFIVLSSKFFF